MPKYVRGMEMHHLGTYTVATLPTAATLSTLAEGDVAYATDALKASETAGNGTGNLGFWDGTAWRRVDTGATIDD